MPIRDLDGNCLTLWKYNFNPQPFKDYSGQIIKLPKVIFSKDKKRTAFCLKDLLEFKKDEILYIVEGEKDCLNAIASVFNAITLGSAGAKIEKSYAFLLKSFYEIVIAYDYDDAGKNGAIKLKEQILKDEICKNVKILDWERVLQKKSLAKNLKDGFDFTDYLIALKK